MAKKQRNKNISHIDAMPTFIHLKGEYPNTVLKRIVACETCGYTERDELGEITYQCLEPRPIASVTIDGIIRRRCTDHLADLYPSKHKTEKALTAIVALLAEADKEDMATWQYSHSLNHITNPDPTFNKIKRDCNGAIIW